MTQKLVVKKGNTLIGFNILAVVEWDANANFLNELQQGFREASSYLYDATDGQMLLEYVTIVDDNLWATDADYHFAASNTRWPNSGAEPGQLIFNSSSHPYFGRGWQHGLKENGPHGGRYDLPDGFRTFIHEFGHYGLGLWDSYMDVNNKDGAHCISSAIDNNNTDSINATLMYRQYNASEFSMKDVIPLWSPECENTYQWYKTKKSDWEWILLFPLYKDPNPTPRWTLKSPASFGGVVPGPNAIPIFEWTSVDTGTYAETNACEPPITYTGTNIFNQPVNGADVFLRKSSRDIPQGKTDTDGTITVLGASSGDQLIFNLRQTNIQTAKIQVSCGATSITSPLTPDQSVEVQLVPAAFDLKISTLPVNVTGRLQILITASTTLLSTPNTSLTQLGSSIRVPVPLSYDSDAQAYIGEANLDPSLPETGVIHSVGTNTAGQFVEVASEFRINSIQQDQDTSIYSNDGQMMLYFPAGSLSASGEISIYSAQSIAPIPSRKVLLSGPYTIQAPQNVNLIGSANLTFSFVSAGGSLAHANLGSAQIYQLIAGTWQPLTSNAVPSQYGVSGTISTFGTFAAFATWEAKIYLPRLSKELNSSLD